MVVGGMKIGHTLQILFSEMKTLMSCHQQTRPLPLHCHQAECLCWLHENEMYYAWLEKKNTKQTCLDKRKDKTPKRGNVGTRIGRSPLLQQPTFNYQLSATGISFFVCAADVFELLWGSAIKFSLFATPKQSVRIFWMLCMIPSNTLLIFCGNVSSKQNSMSTCVLHSSEIVFGLSL